MPDKKSRIKQIFDRVVHGLTNEIDILGRPITDNALHRLVDTPQFKAACVMSVVNGIVMNSITNGDFTSTALGVLATFAGGLLTSTDHMAFIERELSTDSAINKDPTVQEVIKYGALSVAETEELKFEHSESSGPVDFKLSVVTVPVAVAALLFNETLFNIIEEPSDVIRSFRFVANAAQIFL